MARAHLKLLAWQQSPAVYLCGADYLGIVHGEGKKKLGGGLKKKQKQQNQPAQPPPENPDPLRNI